MGRKYRQFAALILFSPLPFNSLASNISRTEKFAWGHSGGRHKHQPAHGSVNVSADHLECYSWA